MLVAFSLLIEPGDEVILGAPHYACYPNFIRYCGGVPVSVETHLSDGWRLDPEAVQRVVGPRTRAIIVGSPANPTGAVQDPATLRSLADLGPVTHVRFNIHPDGGVSRLRLFGKPEWRG